MNKKRIIEIQSSQIRNLWLTQLFLLFILFGNHMNGIVIDSNGKKMPVLFDYKIESDGYFSYQNDSEVKYPYLKDRYRIYQSMWSLGDFVMAISLFFYLIFWFSIIISNNKLENEKR